MIVETSMQRLIANTEMIPTTKRHMIADQVILINGFRVVRLGKDVVFEASTSTGHHPKIRVAVEEDENSQTILKLVDNTELRITPVSRTNDDVQVSCDCDDFFHRFAKINSRHGVLFGKIDRIYIPKGTPRTYQHPIPDAPAVCKHLIKLTDFLQASSIIR